MSATQQTTTVFSKVSPEDQKLAKQPAIATPEDQKLAKQPAIATPEDQKLAKQPAKVVKKKVSKKTEKKTEKNIEKTDEKKTEKNIEKPIENAADEPPIEKVDENPIEKVDEKVKKCSSSQEECISQEDDDSVSSGKKKASLPAKYGKFIHFAYYLVETLKGSLPEGVDTEKLLCRANVFGADVSQQTSFVQTFLDSEKSIAADIKNTIKVNKRNQQKSEKAILKFVAKINRSKNVSHTLNSDGSIQSILFNKKNPCTDPLLLSSLLVKQALSSTPSVSTDIVAQIVTAANTNTNNTEDSDSEHIEVSLVTIQDTQYLIDANNTLYDTNTQTPIANYNPNTLSITTL
jgi:hypothetical protein